MRGPKKAIVRSQNGEAQDRVDWKRNGWPDAKIEVRSAICEMSSSERRGKREERREKREEQVRSAIWEMSSSERRGKRAERREKREERDRHDQDQRVEGRNGLVPEWRDGTEKGRPLRGRR